MPRANINEQVVLSEALALANNEGLEAVTVSSVARKLGVRPASLYSHVRDRDSHFVGIHKLALNELAERVSHDVAGRASTEALIALADAHRSLASEQPGTWAILQQAAPPEVVRSPEAERIATFILAVLRGYPLPESDLVHGVRFVSATINGFLTLSHIDAFAHRSDSQNASWKAAIAALDRALHSWPHEGSLS